jgi:predicted O-linked N-acetylglucosamine transferase (SPINDLY family)
MCDWTGLEAQITKLRDWVMHVPTAQISPFAFIAMNGTTALEQKQCASNWANNLYKYMPATLMDIGLQSSVKKLKIGYLSADFRLHPLAFLISELIEKHDRTQFDIVAYSYGADDKTPERKRLQQAFDDFVDIRGLNDQEAAKKIQDDGVHILVDLTGYTQTSRTGIVALKPAAIHINWLGFAGSMGELNGKPLFDYIIADKTIAPNQPDFSEKVLYLPCYQPNDSDRLNLKASGKPSTKASQHLPEDAFVFCCFNQTFKITPDVFAVWMRLLRQAPNSVLWLLECNPWAKENLQGEATLAGVDAKRLIFAPRVPIAEHLARHVNADLFLDTLPYNAHTTASDALWMGLPVLTCMGNTFASRVAASLLNSVKLPELITNSLQEYELKALDFAQNPTKIMQIKQKLDAETSKSKLFDTAQFAKDIEQQYLNVWLNFIK